jgi:hypothetical protein
MSGANPRLRQEMEFLVRGFSILVDGLVVVVVVVVIVMEISCFRIRVGPEVLLRSVCVQLHRRIVEIDVPAF